MEKGKMHNIISAAIFAAIMAVLSQFTFPIGPVPITLQSFVCALAGGVLGRKWGAISIGVWLLLGLLGIPILTMGKAGAGEVEAGEVEPWAKRRCASIPPAPRGGRSF